MFRKPNGRCRAATIRRSRRRARRAHDCAPQYHGDCVSERYPSKARERAIGHERPIVASLGAIEPEHHSRTGVPEIPQPLALGVSERVQQSPAKPLLSKCVLSVRGRSLKARSCKASGFLRRLQSRILRPARSQTHKAATAGKHPGRQFAILGATTPVACRSRSPKLRALFKPPTRDTASIQSSFRL